MTSVSIGRFAPSTTGEAHLGTLLAATLAWLTAKVAGGRCLLRLEDLDPVRSQPHLVCQMEQDLKWLGLTFDGTVRQSTLADGHERALDTFARLGLLYACTCSRAHIAQHGRIAPTGERIYDNACRASRRLTQDAWRHAPGALRVQVDGLQSDPIVRRRDHSVAYLLACVVDDAAMGISEVVRGRDLLDQEPIQRALGSMLGLPIPSYRHHLLLMEPRGRKLAKLHGSLPISQLKMMAPSDTWLGTIAFLAGLRPTVAPTTAQGLLTDFDFEMIAPHDRVVTVHDGLLMVGPSPASAASNKALSSGALQLHHLELSSSQKPIEG